MHNLVCFAQNNQWLFMILLFYASIQALFAISMALLHMYIWDELPEHIRPHVRCVIYCIYL